MSTTEDVGSALDTPDDAALIGQLFDFMLTQARASFVELGIAATLAGGPRLAAEAADATGCDPDAVARLLRVLTNAGLCQRDADDRYDLTPAGHRLVAEDGVGEFAVYLARETYDAWADLSHSIRTGQPAFEHLQGRPYFDWLDEHPTARRRFGIAMEQTVASRLGPLLAHDWPTGALVADVGGGTGVALAAVLERNASLEGVVLDLPGVVDEAEALFARRGLAARARAVAADFFAPLPESADVIVLSQILHDWPDADAARILGHCRDALRPGGAVLVLDAVVDRPGTPRDVELLDLNMLVMLGGRERTLAEWERLVASVALRIESVRDGSRGTLLELRPER